jgi:hypothetical protein
VHFEIISLASDVFVSDEAALRRLHFDDSGGLLFVSTAKNRRRAPAPRPTVPEPATLSLPGVSPAELGFSAARAYLANLCDATRHACTAGFLFR